MLFAGLVHPLEKAGGLIAEYRFVSESLASQYGCLDRGWTDDGDMFLFESADAAAQFGLKLLETWRIGSESLPALAPFSELPIRLGCHFGECTPLDGGWIGRAKGVEGEAEPDSLYVTENVIDRLDLPLYTFEEVGARALEGDHIPVRTLYRIRAFDSQALAAKPPEDLSAEAWFLKGAGLIGTLLENSEQEAECYRSAIELRPDYAEAHSNYAVLLRARGDESGAARHYLEALRVRPDYPEAHYNYGMLLEARGTVSAADEHYREALRLRPDYPEAHNNYAILLEHRGELARAVEHYREGLRLRPAYPQAHYNYALLLENRGDLAAAEEHYREAVVLWPEYGEAHGNLAVLLQMRGDLGGAEEHYRRALEFRPGDPETHYNYGLLLRSRGEEDAAERHFSTASELAPDVQVFRSALEGQ